MTMQGNPVPIATRTIAGVSDLRRTDSLAVPRTDWPDEMLMAAVCARDEQAFVALYERYADLVYSTSLRVLADRQLAEDTAQDVFSRLWNHPQSFIAERGRFLSWLMSVTRNRSVDELRARARRLHRQAGSGTDNEELMALVPAPETEDPARSAQLSEERIAVQRALATLPGEQRQALEFAYFGGLTQQEIAARTGEPLGTVKTRIRLGMQKLRRALEDRV